MTDKPHYVYRLFDAEGRLLYVGCSSQPRRRLSAHKRRAWWPEVASSDLAGPFDYATARHMEQRAIYGENPAHNIVHTLAHGDRIRIANALRREQVSA